MAHLAHRALLQDIHKLDIAATNIKCFVMAFEASYWSSKSLLALLLKMHSVLVYALATLRGTADLLVMTFSQMGQADSSDSTML